MTVQWRQNNEHNTTRENSNSEKIINSLNENLINLYDKSNRKHKTKNIKKQLINLGHKLGYKVYANGLSEEEVKLIGHKFVNREWLYDIHWYTESGIYEPITLPLACESEWGYEKKNDITNKYSSVKYDYQKLLTTNADLKLMIFRVRKVEDLEELGNYFNKTIQSYKNLVKDSKFLFIAFYDRQKKFYYTEINKK